MNAALTCRAGTSAHAAVARAASTSAGGSGAGGVQRRIGTPGLADSDEEEGDSAIFDMRWSSGAGVERGAPNLPA